MSVFFICHEKYIKFGTRLRMKQQDLHKFIGIPYKFLGTDFDGCDCIGLCQLFMRSHGIDITWRDGRPIRKDWYLTEPFRLARWLCTYFNKVPSIDALQYGDIVLFEINGESHTGIYVGNAKVLTILEVFKTSMIMHLKKQNVFYQYGKCANVIYYIIISIQLFRKVSKFQ